MSSRASAPAEIADRQAAAPDVLLLRQEAGRVLEQALGTLPFYERTALVWLMQYGCSYQEIAARMDTCAPQKLVCHITHRLIQPKSWLTHQ
jgi:DNA-directed RNA polymerase specialized sigma24 family protein